MNQLIYRQQYTAPFELADMVDYEFVECRRLSDGIKNADILFRHRGILGFLKDVAKLITPQRSYFFITDGKRIISEVYVTVGQCRHYDVEDESAVLGPVWTDVNTRGKGLATGLLKRTINALIKKEHNILYIDTSENNMAMQSVIARCGFCKPVKRIEKLAHKFHESNE